MDGLQEEVDATQASALASTLAVVSAPAKQRKSCSPSTTNERNVKFSDVAARGADAEGDLLARQVDDGPVGAHAGIWKGNF